MSMISPGMDPYLEAPAFWVGVHNRLIVYLADQLRPKLRPRYLPAIEERVFVAGPVDEFRPDVHIRRSPAPRPGGGAVAVADEADAPLLVAREDVHESYVNILDLGNDQHIVAVIEVLSPTNKYAGPGRDSYRAKQREVLASDAHLVEIDLLRHGPHVLAVDESAARERAQYDYLSCVTRASPPGSPFELYPTPLRNRLPRIAIPLADDDPPVVLDVQDGIERVYEAGGYRDRIDYARACVPRLDPADQTWANDLIRAAAAPPPA